MAYQSVSDITSGELADTDKVTTIKNNIDNLRSRLAEAGSWNWTDNPPSSGDVMEKENINELQDALDDSHNKNNCQDCTDNSDRSDDTDRGDNADCSDVGDRGDLGDNNDDSVDSQHSDDTDNNEYSSDDAYDTNNLVNQEDVN